MSAISRVIQGRARDLGDGFVVRRVLPSGSLNMVGPFIFFDHMGPVSFASGPAINVRPHPHIALATVTYLFDGEILHRDSLGSVQEIKPGDVNWMIAGRGIVHSERTTPHSLQHGVHLHGIQSWVALPDGHEDDEPAFKHHPRVSLPQIERSGVQLRVIAGEAFGRRSPVDALWPTLYVDAALPGGAEFELGGDHDERAIYVAEGEARIDGEALPAGSLALLTPGSTATIGSPGAARLMLLGGARFPTARLISWNFVASSAERLEQARRDWRERNVDRFPNVPGDAVEFIPLP
jgi:redox-sensitive bicupin YhaK (pirin superfamily)